jgi:polysaccharide biosynthesis protein PslH
VLRLLAREFEVTALCFYRKATLGSIERVRDSVASLQAFGEIEVFSIPQEHSKARLLADHLRSVLSQRAYTVFAYDSADFRRRLRQTLKETRFDLVHMDSLDLAGYLAELRDLPVVCVHHNVESVLLRRRATSVGGLAGRYMELQARFTQREEVRWCRRVALNVAVSPDDRDTLLELVPDAAFTVVPNGVDTEIFRPPGLDPGSQDAIVFVGGFEWQPNRVAMEFFCSEVLPILRNLGVHAPVKWIGRAEPEVVRQYADRHNVHLTGYVDDIRPLVDGAACYIAPLQSGGGTRLKILDAWAMGKAVVSTSVGCEGLDARDDENILVRNDPEAFAQAIANVVNDVQLRERIGREARRTAESLYDWEVIGRPMLARYRELASAPRGVSVAG